MSAIPRRVLQTGRLSIQPVNVGLADAIWHASKASLPELRPWLAWAAGANFDATRSFAEECERQWEEGRSFQFSLVERSSAEVVGGVGLSAAVPGKMGSLGYWIRSDRAGVGYATEAGRAVVEFSFEQVGVYRIELRAGVENLASLRVAEKLGFVREGLLRMGCEGADRPYDCYIYGLLAPDPRPTRR